ncbi:MAG: division/cell wall cluster transcriptional repressor MraZ [Candidatus Muproteobacteria bacterium RBG_16_65_34]|uniref:Transcriptional regulator MraZ n=1 Tax=Candidatus Muproteobacteria bacterium RBG_16_65_34 TaxID=1817760 RepID=A0A1F6TQG2_9PROT|nr:MAG: division/cell wall cluster transcriptional repressor MraZ [Candidatus Muproteobacteria bacterium RBG_16_65_34]
MFRGVNDLSLDSKGRLAIPTRYREEIARNCNGQMVMTVDRDHCLLLYPLPDWEEIERKLVKLPSLNKQARRLQRLLIGHATECDLDGAGRILLPPPLREFAGLNKDVMLIGQGNKFEIWDAQAWNVRRAEWLAEGGADEGKPPSELESLSL